MSEVVPLPPVYVWKVKDEALRIYENGREVASIPARDFANLGVSICQELTRQSRKTAAR